MKIARTQISWLLTLFVVLIAQGVQAQFHVITIEDRPFSAGNAPQQEFGLLENSLMYFHSDFMRMDNQKGTEVLQSVLYDRENERVYMVDHTSKKFFQMDQERANELKVQIESMKAMMEERIKSLPEDQREMAEKMMAQQVKGMKTNFQYAKTGETAKINGYESSRYYVREEGELERELWVTSCDELGLSKKEVKCLQSFSNLMASVAETIGSSLVGNNFFLIEETEGLPVRTINYEYEKPKSTTDIISIEEYEPSNDFFGLPAGYTEETINTGP